MLRNTTMSRRWLALLPVVVLLAGCSASYDELSGTPREVLVRSNGWDDVVPGDLTKACLPDRILSARWEGDHDAAVVTCALKGDK